LAPFPCSVGVRPSPFFPFRYDVSTSLIYHYPPSASGGPDMLRDRHAHTTHLSFSSFPFTPFALRLGEILFGMFCSCRLLPHFLPPPFLLVFPSKFYLWPLISFQKPHSPPFDPTSCIYSAYYVSSDSLNLSFPYHQFF